MTAVVVLVPRRRDQGRRDRLWTFARARWAALGWPIVEGHHEAHEGPFNRSAAVNRAAANAGAWDVAVVIDADVVPDPAAIRAAVAVAVTDRPVIAYTARKHLTKDGTEKVLAGFSGSWQPFVKLYLENACSGAYVVSRRLFDAVGGFDECFSGWGWEDVAFRISTALVAGQEPARIDADLWHLWHPVSPERSESTETFKANRARGDRYKQARRARDLELLRGLLAEANEVPPTARLDRYLATPPARMLLDRPAPAETSIPRILHRTVPADTSPEVEEWWEKAKILHPDWQPMDHRDPLDPAEWPETGDLWHLCGSGAQKAGLIRLEALYRWGGIYLDSDVEPLRPLDPLLGLEGFAAWEDVRTVPDAVLGFRRGHPALAIMLEKARAAIEEGAGAWASGPGVTTSTLPGRADVALFPPGSFYPYHYSEKHREGEDHAAGSPWAFAVHHWRHSWRGR